LGTELIPDPTTAGDFCRRFAEADVAELMERVNAVRPKLWTGRGRELFGPVAFLDVDGTIAPTHGQHKAGIDISYKPESTGEMVFRWCVWDKEMLLDLG
jgi:hypothetical protein